jgi:hypothetical protein
MAPFVVSAGTGALTGLAITYTRRLKWPVVSGASLYFIGLITMVIFLRRGWPDFVYILCLFPMSMGQGFQFPGTIMAILGSSEQREQAVVTSTLSLWRSLGMILGVASSSLVVQNALIYYLNINVVGPEREAVIEKVRGSVQAIAKLDPPYREQAVMSYEAAINDTFKYCIILAAISVVLVLPINLKRLPERKK